MVFGEQNFLRRIAKVDCLVQELPEQYRARERDFILEWLDGGSALQRLRVPAQLAARLEDWHTQSLVVVEGDSRVHLVRKARGQAIRLQTSFLMWQCMLHQTCLSKNVRQTRTSHTLMILLPLSLTTVRGSS